MRTDYFAVLAQPRRLWLEEEALRTKFHALSALVHPDRVHSASAAEKSAAQQQYTQLNAAFTCLRDPRQRVRHWLELELGHPPSDLTTIPEALLNLFFALGKTLRAADQVVAEQASITSPLLRISRFEQAQALGDELTRLREQVAARREELLQELRRLDAVQSPSREGVLEVWRWLSFYDRWLAQIQERIVRLTFS